ncbi:MAG TPA: hypothetical protein VFY90_00260 [Tepidiformaceae bacterium]|nr:hypothetical protein [Tepidiformaceae bacterium]
MRSLEPQTTTGNKASLRVHKVARAAHLRVIERIGPSRETTPGRVVPFHRHLGPKPAA